MIRWVGLGVLAVVGAASFQSLPRERVLAGYATTLDGRTTSQRHNSRLAAQAIDGAVIGPGQMFSFNERVGSFTRDQGYRKAPVSYNGQLIDAWGGGVCQTSTTLYNAALLAGFVVIERHPHRFAPSYVPPGRDAAVAYWNIDLKLRNPHPFPVRVVASAEGGRVVVQLAGTGELEARPEIVSDVKQRSSGKSFQFTVAGKPTRVRNTGKDGWVVVTTRVTPGGRERISVDEYPAMNRLTQVGTP